jgi:hypothetical protein
MTPLEKRKKELELARVRLARQELEVHILERQEDIKRLQDHIEKQIKTEKELEEILNSLSTEG